MKSEQYRVRPDAFRTNVNVSIINMGSGFSGWMLPGLCGESGDPGNYSCPKNFFFSLSEKEKPDTEPRAEKRLGSERILYSFCFE